MEDEDDVPLEVLEAAARAPEHMRRDEEEAIENLDDDRRCAICLSSPQRLSLRCSLLPCGHSAFCVSCVRQWLLQGSRKRTCPLCLRLVSSFVDGRGTETEVAAAEVGGEAGAARGGHEDDDDDDDDEAAAARSLRNWVASSAPLDPYGRGDDGARMARRRVPASGGSYSRGVARLSAAAAAAAAAAEAATRRRGAAEAGAATARRRLPDEQSGEEEEPGLQWRREIYRRGLERAGGRTTASGGVVFQRPRVKSGTSIEALRLAMDFSLNGPMTDHAAAS